MLFKTLAAIAFFSACSICYVQPCMAQSAAVEISGQRLADIEREMFNDSNDNYIVVDLLIDGVMKPGDKCNLHYDNGVMYFNDRKMVSKLQDKYVHRFKEFLAYTGQSQSISSWRMQMDPVTTEKILDPNSTFRKPSPNMLKLQQKAQQLRSNE